MIFSKGKIIIIKTTTTATAVAEKERIVRRCLECLCQMWKFCQFACSQVTMNLYGSGDGEFEEIARVGVGG